MRQGAQPIHATISCGAVRGARTESECVRVSVWCGVLWCGLVVCVRVCVCDRGASPSTHTPTCACSS
jgi:hypothetical protein